MRVPSDTLDVLESLVKESKRAIEEVSIPTRLLLTGAIIDAENLIAEIKFFAAKPGH